MESLQAETQGETQGETQAETQRVRMQQERVQIGKRTDDMCDVTNKHAHTVTNTQDPELLFQLQTDRQDPCMHIFAHTRLDR